MQLRFALLPAVLCLASLTLQAVRGAPPTAKTSATPRAEGPKRLDHYGDLLPEGALTRLGTVRWRHGGATWLAYDVDGKSIYSAFLTFSRGMLKGAAQNEVRQWNLRDGHELRRWRIPTSDYWKLLADVNLARRVVAFYNVGNNTIDVWDMKRRKAVVSIKAGYDFYEATLSPSGKRLAAWSREQGTVHVWDAATGKPVCHLDSGSKPDHSPVDFYRHGLQFAPDESRLALLVGKNTLHLWEVPSGKKFFKRTEKDAWINTLAFAPDGRLLAWSTKKSICLWDVDHDREWRRITVADGDVAGLAFSPDGWMLAMNRRQKTIPVWETATGRQCLLLKGHEESTVCVTFAPDGRTLASASWDETIRLWDLDTGRELRKLTGHRGKANSLAFSADGKILVSAGDDTTILFWDVASVTHRKRPHTAPLAKQEWQALWEDLAKDDAAKAYAAMVRMAADGPTTIAALKKRLRPICPVDPKRLAGLLKELDSDEFAVREAATRELEKRGDVIGPAVRQTLARPGLSLELRRRLEAISASLDEISGARLRSLRAVEALELAGTKKARDMLKTLAAGAEGARLTHETKAARERLTRRGEN